MDISEDFNIPSMPEHISYCLSAIYKNEVLYEKLAEKISRDVGLSKKILTIGNSVNFAQGIKTNDLKQAIIRIGVISLTKILTEEYYKKSFSNIEIGFFNLKSFNRHSNCVSLLSAEIAKYLNMENINILMLAGLFHDIGLLARAFFQKEIMRSVIEKCASEKIDFTNCEKQKILLSHDSLGKKILSKWQLDDDVVHLVEFHHTPENLIPASLSHLRNSILVLSLSDMLAHRMNCSFCGYVRDTRVPMIVLDKLKLKKEVLISIMTDISKMLENGSF